MSVTTKTESLDQALQIAYDDILKAKTAEEKNDATNRFVAIQKLVNERQKIRNEKELAESRLEMETEKAIKENAIEQDKIEEERIARNRERRNKMIVKGVEFALVGVGIGIQCVMLHQNYIEMDPVGKGTTKGIIGKFGDYLRG